MYKCQSEHVSGCWGLKSMSTLQFNGKPSAQVKKKYLQNWDLTFPTKKVLWVPGALQIMIAIMSGLDV